MDPRSLFGNRNAPLSSGRRTRQVLERSGVNLHRNSLVNGLRAFRQFKDLASQSRGVNQFCDCRRDVIAANLGVELRGTETDCAETSFIRKRGRAQDYPVQATFGQCDFGLLLHRNVMLETFTPVLLAARLRKYRNQDKALDGGVLGSFD